MPRIDLAKFFMGQTKLVGFFGGASWGNTFSLPSQSPPSLSAVFSEKEEGSTDVETSESLEL